MNIKTFCVLATSLFLGLLTAPTRAQLGESEFLPPTEAFRVSAVVSGADQVRVEFLVTPGYYLYRHRLNFALEGVDGGSAPPASLGTALIPPGEWKEDEFFGRQQVFHEGFTVSVPVSRAPGGVLPATLVVGLQGCADAGLCYPPEKRRLRIELPPTQGSATASTPLRRRWPTTGPSWRRRWWWIAP
jgi:thiol:disulfide interchange protein DsbD